MTYQPQHHTTRADKERLRVYLPTHLSAYCNKQPQGSARFIEQLILDHIRNRIPNPEGRNVPQRTNDAAE